MRLPSAGLTGTLRGLKRLTVGNIISGSRALPPKSARVCSQGPR